MNLNLKPQTAQDIIIAISISMILGAALVAITGTGPMPQQESAVIIDGLTSTNTVIVSNRFIWVTNIEYSVIVVGDKRQPTNSHPTPTAEVESEPDRVVRELIAEGMTRDEAVDTYKRWMEWARIKRQTEVDYTILPGTTTNEPDRRRFPLFEE